MIDVLAAMQALDEAEYVYVHNLYRATIKTAFALLLLNAYEDLGGKMTEEVASIRRNVLHSISEGVDEPMLPVDWSLAFHKVESFINAMNQPVGPVYG